MPGPGSYEYTIDKTIASEGIKIENSKMIAGGKGEDRVTHTAFFKSTTDRFAKIDA